MEKKEWIIGENGGITERYTREREIEAEQAIIDALSENVFRKVCQLIKIPEWGVAHASIGMQDIIWSIEINRLPLNAKFRLVNQVLVPMFGSTPDLEMPMVWEKQGALRLVFVVRTEPLEDYHSINGNWLFAYNEQRNAYRLPLPNLYDDCTICTGEFKGSHETAIECVQASLEQFRKSQWNSDLIKNLEQSQKFFRFRPNDEGFDTLPIDATDWTTLCTKVSTAMMDRVIL
jgi:hypothetical protein